jgi:antitoxin (DNA-binding transcriptional repressor) of toxin-antitoxin stability system
MKAVGVKSLKNQLSRYLKEVQAGETILVTDREQVIAEIHGPTSSASGRVDRWEAFLSEQERRGTLRRPTRPDVTLRVDLPPLPRRVDIARLLDDTRADRD